MKGYASTIAAAALTLCAVISGSAQSAVLVETFDSPATISPFLQPNLGPGFDFSVINGRGLFSKSAGTQNGFGYLATTFRLAGDFTVSVDMAKEDLSGIGEAGLLVNYSSDIGAPVSFADIWSFDVTSLVANIFVPSAPGFGTSITPSSAHDMTFTIQRTGNTLALLFDDGAGQQLLRSAASPLLSEPLYAQLFLGQESGNANAHLASFDNLRIEAEGFIHAVPEPSTSILFLRG